MTRGIGAAALLALVLAIGAAAPAAGESRFSGTVVAVDAAAGTLVVEGMGPWRPGDDAAPYDRRTVRVTPATAVGRVARAGGVAPSGWTGDFVESPLPFALVRPGDWVTVTFAGDPATAVRVLVSERDPS